MIILQTLPFFNARADISSNEYKTKPFQWNIACTIHICLVQTKTLNLFFDLTRRQKLKVRKYVGKSDKIFVR